MQHERFITARRRSSCRCGGHIQELRRLPGKLLLHLPLVHLRLQRGALLQADTEPDAEAAVEIVQIHPATTRGSSASNKCTVTVTSPAACSVFDRAAQVHGTPNGATVASAQRIRRCRPFFERYRAPSRCLPPPRTLTPTVYIPAARRPWFVRHRRFAAPARPFRADPWKSADTAPCSGADHAARCARRTPAPRARELPPRGRRCASLATRATG